MGVGGGFAEEGGEEGELDAPRRFRRSVEMMSYEGFREGGA